jgi:hypothetical protein
MNKVNSLVFASMGAVLFAMVPSACGDYTALDGAGGRTGSGGAESGGAPGAGGAGSGGVSSSGGAISSGGVTGSGGGSAGGSAASGGVPSSGGVAASGGVAGGTSGRDGSVGAGGATDAGGAMATGGAGPVTGGRTGAGGGIGSGGSVGSGGATGSGGSTGTGGSTTPEMPLPCDVLTTGGNKCVSAHSTVRVIVRGYTGPLYQLCKGTANAGPASCKGTMQDVGSKDGYADAAAQDTFCSGTSCTITKIYDQSGQGNHLEPAPKGGAKNTPDNPAIASDLKVTINGHAAYGILIKSGIGYRTGCSGCTIKQGNGMVKGDDPESMYWVTSQKDLVDGCCFDYGNAETTSNDDGNGTMETLYFGGGVVWGTGSGGKPGPWIMADLENGLYAGWENKQDKNISTNTPLKYDFVTGILLGDTKDKNSGKGRFALYGGDATTGTLKTMYDGIRPEKPGYVPMQKQGSIILGIGGDNSNGAGGRFYEGAISVGPVISKETLDALQAAIVAAKYGK